MGTVAYASETGVFTQHGSGSVKIGIIAVVSKDVLPVQA